jgi:hypothetical protein
LRALFTGHFINIFRECTYLIVYFVVNEYLRRLYLVDFGPLAVPVAGGLSGAAAWMASFPFDMIKSRIQGIWTVLEWDTLIYTYTLLMRERY